MGNPVLESMKRRIAAAILSLSAVTTPAWAQEEDVPDVDAFARVIVGETELRSGPGVSHRVVSRASRGDTLFIRGREGSGFWLQVSLPDGRTAYVLGDTVEPIGFEEDEVDRPKKPGFFAPPALEEANAGFALLGGIYRENGYIEAKIGWVIAPPIALEPYVGIAQNTDGRTIIVGGGGTLSLFPDWPATPYVHIGGGGLFLDSSDEFIVEDQEFFHARAGGGLLVSLRWRILVRLEVMNVTRFTQERYANFQSYTGGFGTYF